MKYLIVIESTESGYAAYSPDLPGCVATGRTAEEVKHNMREAVGMHVEGLQQEGVPVPRPSSQADYVEIAA